MTVDLSQLEKDTCTPVSAVTEIRQHLPETAPNIAAALGLTTTYVLETLDAMQRVGIVVASDGDPPVWRIRRLRPHCASSGQV